MQNSPSIVTIQPTATAPIVATESQFLPYEIIKYNGNWQQVDTFTYCSYCIPESAQNQDKQFIRDLQKTRVAMDICFMSADRIYILQNVALKGTATVVSSFCGWLSWFTCSSHAYCCGYFTVLACVASLLVLSGVYVKYPYHLLENEVFHDYTFLITKRKIESLANASVPLPVKLKVMKILFKDPRYLEVRREGHILLLSRPNHGDDLYRISADDLIHWKNLNVELPTITTLVMDFLQQDKPASLYIQSFDGKRQSVVNIVGDIDATWVKVFCYICTECQYDPRQLLDTILYEQDEPMDFLEHLSAVIYDLFGKGYDVKPLASAWQHSMLIQYDTLWKNEGKDQLREIDFLSNRYNLYGNRREVIESVLNLHWYREDMLSKHPYCRKLCILLCMLESPQFKGKEALQSLTWKPTDSLGPQPKSWLPSDDSPVHASEEGEVKPKSVSVCSWFRRQSNQAIEMRPLLAMPSTAYGGAAR